MLVFAGKPKILSQPEKVISTPAGKDVTIECKVEGYPRPLMAWTYNSQPLRESDTITFSFELLNRTTVVLKLLIKNIQNNNIGYYGCKSVNEHGQSYAESLVTIS